MFLGFSLDWQLWQNTTRRALSRATSRPRKWSTEKRANPEVFFDRLVCVGLKFCSKRQIIPLASNFLKDTHSIT